MVPTSKPGKRLAVRIIISRRMSTVSCSQQTLTRTRSTETQSRSPLARERTRNQREAVRGARERERADHVRVARRVGHPRRADREHVGARERSVEPRDGDRSACVCVHRARHESHGNGTTRVGGRAPTHAYAQPRLISATACSSGHVHGPIVAGVQRVQSATASARRAVTWKTNGERHVVLLAWQEGRRGWCTIWQALRTCSNQLWGSSLSSCGLAESVSGARRIIPNSVFG
jgi:hypothetical protein